METIAARLLALAGLCAVLVISCTALRPDAGSTGAVDAAEGKAVWNAAGPVRFLAVGDVNLGRAVGQEILEGDTLYPFLGVRDTFALCDVVFANLESSLSDQDGETESPRNNLVFTGPPAGASALRGAGITVVSTANNHALDYGLEGAEETLNYLDDAGIVHAGTAFGSRSPYTPAVFQSKGVRFAVFACTDLMNGSHRGWWRTVAKADTGALLGAIRCIRDSVDFIIVSYHGGEEYAPHPADRTKGFAAAVIDGGADLFLGHHPHVSYGIEQRQGKYIVHSLGNFVFRQPARYSTRWSFAFTADIRKNSTGTRIETFRCIPVSAGFQPSFVVDGTDAEAMYDRIRVLSSRDVTEHISW